VTAIRTCVIMCASSGHRTPPTKARPMTQDYIFRHTFKRKPRKRRIPSMSPVRHNGQPVFYPAGHPLAGEMMMEPTRKGKRLWSEHIYKRKRPKGGWHKSRWALRKRLAYQLELQTLPIIDLATGLPVPMYWEDIDYQINQLREAISGAPASGLSSAPEPWTAPEPPKPGERLF
jgi:hypothetical protein